MLVIASTHVQRSHLDGHHPVLIELQLKTSYGDPAGTTCAVLSPALADELGVALQTLAASDFDVPVGS